MRFRHALTIATTVAVVITSFLLGGSAQAQPGDGRGATIVVTDHSATATDQSVFTLQGIKPGDRYTFPVYLRNDSTQGAEVTFLGFEYRDTDPATGEQTDDLREHTTITLTNNGTVIGSGQGDSRTLTGARVYIPAGTTQKLGSQLVMPASVGNEAQGEKLHVIYRFSVALGAAGGTIETGVPAGPEEAGLPPTGESLGAFHALVWAALGTFAALLLGLFLAALRRRDEEERPQAVTIFDDVPNFSRSPR